MSDTTQTNAMAEIALALAMGFFSIMVLTMVSMGSGMVSEKTPTPAMEDPLNIARTVEKPTTPQKKTGGQNVKPENLVIFYEGRFLDHSLQPVQPTQLVSQDQLVLAVSPDLSMAETMSVRQQVGSKDLTVVVLNDDWLKALKGGGK